MKKKYPADSHFVDRAHDGMQDVGLQKSLNLFRNLAPPSRLKAVSRLTDFEELRQWVTNQTDIALKNSAQLLESFEKNVQMAGGHVHWADTPEDANTIVVELCRNLNTRNIVKGKSMISEETGLLQALEAANFNTLETDLGEYIIQLADEPPSHIIGPAIHKTFEQVVDLFKDHHDVGPRDLPTPKAVMAEAREVLRSRFLEADVGITGANYLIADTGTIGLVTNEGNGDLTATLPDTHIVVTSIEKIVPNMDVAMGIQRLLVPSATAQDITCYTSFFTGSKRATDNSGPSNFHIVLLNNKRTDILQSAYKDILRCIRCSACLNHCPVYTRTGGHAYNAVYPGPMGSVWSPLLHGMTDNHELPNACTACGRCTEVCPMDIPLADLLRDLRHDEQQQKLQPKRWVWGMALFMWLLKKPRLFHFISSLAIRIMHKLGKQTGYFRTLLLANGWTSVRDFPAPEENTFMVLYKNEKSVGAKRND